MIIAARTKKADTGLTLNQSGHILNTLYGFETQAEFQSAMDAAWEEGGNLLELSAHEKLAAVGTTPVLASDNRVFAGTAAAEWHEGEIKEIEKRNAEYLSQYFAKNGAKGGASKTDAKRQAAAENGRKGGRPKKKE